MDNTEYREQLKNRKRIVVKVGSSSLLHPETGRMDYRKLDRLVRELSDLKNAGKEVILVTSGAAAVGREAINMKRELVSEDSPVTVKQACAAIGQARLMMIYQRFFEQYNQLAAQVLMTRDTITNILSKYNLHNTFTELLKLGVIPVVNENDSVATAEFSVGDNDNLSALVASVLNADLLILLSDVDGLYTDDPRNDPKAEFIEFVEHLDETTMKMGKSSTGSGSGTGGMSTKLHAALVATRSGCDMVIVESGDMSAVHKVTDGENIGTLFKADKDPDFDLARYLLGM